MKLKKLLAAVTAAALAVSTMAVTSFTASAAEITADDWQMTSTADSITYSITSPEDSETNQPSIEKTVDISSLVNETEDNTFRCVNVTATGAGSPYVNSTGLSDGPVKITDKDALSNVKIGTWWIEPGVTQAITFTVEYGEPLVERNRTITQSNKGNVYTAVVTSAEAPEGSVWNDGADPIKVNLTSLLPEGFSMADVRKITAVTTSPNEWGTGSIGMNVKGTWTALESGWGKANDTCVLSTPDGLNDDETEFQVQLWYAQGGDTVTATVTVEDKDGNVYPAEGEEPGEVSVTVTPARANIKAGETVQLEATFTGKDDAVVTWESTDTDVATVSASGLVTGVAEGSCEIRALVDGEFLGTPTSFSVVTVTEEGGSDEVDTSGWKIVANGFTPSWGGWKSAEGTEGKLDFTCTIKDIMDANSITDIDDFGGFIAQTWGVPLGDKVSYAIRIEAADGTVKADDKDTYTVVEGDDGPNYSLKQYAIASCGGNLVFAPTDVVKIVVASGTTIPTFPTTPDDGDDDDNNTTESTALWEGSQAVGWTEGANVQIAAAKFADIQVGDTLKFTITCEDNSQLKIAALTDGWPVLTGPNPDPEWGVVNVSGTSYSFVVNAADVASLKEFGMVVAGQNATVTKIELVPKAAPNPPVVDPTPDDPAHTHTPATTWSSDATGHWHACSGCTDPVDFAAHTSDSGTVTTAATATTAGTKTYKCTVCGYVIRIESIPATGTDDTPSSESPSYSNPGAPVIPTWLGSGTSSNAPAIIGNSGKSGWDAISEEALASPDGTKIEIDMNGTTRVPSSVFKSFRNKDVDIVFDMGRGVKWTVNGLSVTSAKTIDFDFSTSARHIPDEVVDAAEGSYKKQLSLDHNGSFGFAAVMTYDIGTKYDGSYANLFYYNRKTKELELVYCSPISNGKASFVFNHASDYLITVTAEPLGDYEDVSAASGIASGSTNVNAAAFAAVIAVITAAFGVVVYKKRRHN